jgi:RNA polymerase primary sigma factor
MILDCELLSGGTSAVGQASRLSNSPAAFGESLPFPSSLVGQPSRLSDPATGLEDSLPRPSPLRDQPPSPRSDYVLGLYLREVAREPLLAPEEERKLGWRARLADESARRRLVLGSLRLVVHIAWHYRGSGLPLPDLINEGNLGLMRASELFDPRRNPRFAPCASVWIHRHIRRAVCTQAWPVRLPEEVGWQQARIARAEENLASALGRRPLDREIAFACALPLSRVRHLRGTSMPCFVSLHQPLAGNDGPTFGDALPDEQSPSPDQVAASRNDCEFAHHLLTTLEPREQRVLWLRYGLEDGSDHTLAQVGRALGLVRQRIQQIESAALAKLRRRVKSLSRQSHHSLCSLRIVNPRKEALHGSIGKPLHRLQ